MRVDICDGCRNRAREAKRAYIPTGRYESDPAGGASSEIMEIVDLCLDCAVKRLEAR